MKYLIEIRVQVCSAFVLIKNGTKIYFLRINFEGGEGGGHWGGRGKAN